MDLDLFAGTGEVPATGVRNGCPTGGEEVASLSGMRSGAADMIDDSHGLSVRANATEVGGLTGEVVEAIVSGSGFETLCLC